MKSTIAEYGLIIVGAVLVSSFFVNIIPLFQDGGMIKESIINYITNIC